MINTVRGTKDLFGKKYHLYKKISESFEQTMGMYGFERFMMPVMEYASLYENVGETSDIVMKEMFYVKTRGLQEGETVVLRPEGTMSCIRHLLNTGQLDQIDIRLFYNEKMFRYNRPQKGREREFIQLGCEVINSDSVYTEAEQLKCIYSFVKSLGIDFKLHLNTTGSRKSLEGYIQVLREFFQQKAEHLSEKNKARLEQNVLRVLDQLSEAEKVSLAMDFPKLLAHVTDEERDRFSTLCSLLKAMEVEFVVDQFIIRGLDYYEGCVFELVTPDYSIAGGGRYRISRKRLGSDSSSLNHSKPAQTEDVPLSAQDEQQSKNKEPQKGSCENDDILGFGWAIGYERLVQHLEFQEKQETIYLVFALDEPEFAFEIAEMLRWRENKKVRIVFGSMKKCISKANSIKPGYVIFCGTIEKQNRILNLKNWQSGEKLASTLDNPKLDI